MSVRESDLVTVSETEIGLTDYIRVLDGDTSRKMLIEDFMDVIAGSDVYVAVSGDTMSGDLIITNASNPNITVQGTSVSSATVTLISSSASYSALNLGDVADNDIGQIKYDNTTNILSLTSGTIEAISIDGAGDVTVNEDLAVTKTVTVTGAAGFSSTITVTGTSILGAITGTSMDVTGTTTLYSALDVSGLASLDGGIDVDGAFTVANTSGNISTTGTLNVDGATTCGNITVDAISTIDMGANKVTNVAEPTALQDAATKNYVDNSVAAYSEGTWIPVLSDGTNDATMSGTTAGFYEKIGRIVNIRMVVETTSLGSVSGDIRVTGLPFTAASGYPGGVCAVKATGLNIVIPESLTGEVVGGSTYVQLKNWDLTTGTDLMTSTDWSADGLVVFFGSYQV